MRYAFGPSGSQTIRGDLGVVLDSIEQYDGVPTVSVTVPPSDPAIHARPSRVFAVYGPTGPVAGDSPEEFLSRPEHTTGVAEVTGDPALPTSLQIPVPGVPAGVHFVQTVLEYTD